MNSRVYSGDKEADSIVNYCLNRKRGQDGIWKKQYNFARPTSRIGLITSPSNGDMDMVYHPKRSLTRVIFCLYPRIKKGRFETVK